MPGFLHCVGIKGEKEPSYMCVCLDKGRQEEAKKAFWSKSKLFLLHCCRIFPALVQQQPSGWERRGGGRKELVLPIQETDV
jgi:hypothetical protein